MVRLMHRIQHAARRHFDLWKAAALVSCQAQFRLTEERWLCIVHNPCRARGFGSRGSA